MEGEPIGTPVTRYCKQILCTVTSVPAGNISYRSGSADPLILNYDSVCWRPIIYRSGSGSYLNIFLAIEINTVCCQIESRILKILNFFSLKFSVADPGCLSRIPDPTFFHPRSRIRTVSIPDPGSSSKNLSILTPKKAKKWFLSSFAPALIPPLWAPPLPPAARYSAQMPILLNNY
jgi:hypothetical protein